MYIKGKSVLVVGLGTSGIPTVEVLLSLGAKVSCYDKKSKEELTGILGKIDMENVELIAGEFPEDIMKFDIVVLSPGIPTDLPFIQKARAKNICIIGELELAYRLCEGLFIAITGTNGKTTTTALIGEIFKKAQKETHIVGNIGIAAISKARKATKDAVMVTEVSSFQLESVVDFKPHIATILNVTPDHLNRHKTMENYIDAKANIFKNQDENDFLVLNMDNDMSYELKNRTNSQVILFSRKNEVSRGAYVLGDAIVVKEENESPKTICKVDELKIPGNHNLENALAAVVITYWSGIDIEIISDTLKSYMGVEHRIEFVEEINGIRFINDSKGTNPDASIKAIEAMKTPIVLIAGGMDKGSDFNEFMHAFNGKVRHMVLIGQTAEKIKRTAKENDFESVTIVNNMEEAVNCAYDIAKHGDVILLSPACASWDMYKSFEIRGKHFKECTASLRR
ncbi:UDP-N-acetylmuramoyl-L-alanine--D-glutamate ligase [Lutibacter sp. B2]|nr:UDP-N-acetylmuramoyl-L-alanine--D-glutamate ligase [Lutibacter sp. B2]